MTLWCDPIWHASSSSGVSTSVNSAFALLYFTLLTGWDDGRIRTYYPESGRPFYTMDNAYGGSVTALETLPDCRHVISGSNLGHVVVWEVPGVAAESKSGPLHVTRHFLLKEHKAAVTCIRARSSDAECVTSSSDGSCIVWDLQ